jgi:hypothetical protein
LAEKDTTQKILEAHNDVFADIVNVLLFNGEEKVKPDDLTDEGTNSYYKISGKIKSQDRDVAKSWRKNHIRISSFGFENQTVIEKNMPIRVIGYDGASYREQLTKKNLRNGNYPVVTMVLYFGMKRWNKNLSLTDCLNISDDLKPFVSDYKINVFEIAYLTDEQVKMFKSDFKLIADYFVQIRKTGKYVPMPDDITHVWETINLISVLTDDGRFEQVYYNSNKKEALNMCKIIDDFVKQGVEQGIEQGVAQGIEQGVERSTVNNIKNLMLNLNFSLEQAMTALGIPNDKKERYIELINA